MSILRLGCANLYRDARRATTRTVILAFPTVLIGADPMRAGGGSRVGEADPPSDGLAGPPLTRCPRAGHWSAEVDGRVQHWMRAVVPEMICGGLWRWVGARSAGPPKAEAGR